MKVEEEKIQDKTLIKLIADENKIIVSKAVHYDYELEKQVPNIIGEIIVLGIKDKVENYKEIDKEDL